MSIKRNRLLSLLLVVLLIALLGGCAKTEDAPKSSSPAAPAEEVEKAKEAEEIEPIVLRYAATYTELHPQAIADIAWMEKIEKETGGRVKFEPYWGGALMSMDQAYVELSKGVADVSEVSAAYVKEGFEIEKAMRLLFYNVTDTEIARRIYHEIRAKFPEIDEEFKDVKTMTHCPTSPYQLITTKKAVRTVDDFKGLMLKVSGEYANLGKALGADAAPVPMSETYVALQKGTVDGAMVPLECLKSYAFGEVIGYVTMLNMAVGPTPHRVMNLDTWNSLPADIQKIFDDNMEWYGRKVTEELLKFDEEGTAFAKEHGVEFIELSPEELARFHEVTDNMIIEQMGAVQEQTGKPLLAIFEEIQRLWEEYSN